MDVTSQLLHDVEFREAKRGGYNTQDVDEFLERFAVALGRHEAEVQQRIDVAEERIAEAERRANQAEQRSSETTESDDTLKRTLVLAQRTADAAIREAEDEAAQTLSRAQEQANRLLADADDASNRARADAEVEARRAQQDARARVLAEMRELEMARDQLHDDVTVLERHLDEQRERLRHSVGALQELLDNPDALHEVVAPAISDVVTPVVEEPVPMARRPLAVRPLADDAPEAWEPDDEGWEESSRRPEPALADADLGPPTQPVDVLDEADPDDDAYLTELRKAMTDDSPLGPRDDADESLFDAGADAGRTRFGRRR